MPRDRAAARDHGLRRAGSLTRWVLAGGLALSGIFSAVAANAFAGHGTSSTRSPSTTPAVDQQPVSDPNGYGYGGDSGYSGQGLQAPATLPAPSYGGGQIVSGGS